MISTGLSSHSLNRFFGFICQHGVQHCGIAFFLNLYLIEYRSAFARGNCFPTNVFNCGFHADLLKISLDFQAQIAFILLRKKLEALYKLYIIHTH